MAFLTAIRAQQRAGQSLGGMVKNLVIDGGFNHGLTNTSTQWEVFVGVCVPTAASSLGTHHGGHSL